MKIESNLLVNATIALYLLASPLFAMMEEESDQTPHSAFIARQNGEIIEEIGNCDERRPPRSTFKVALALMGFDAEIFKSKNSPEMPFKHEYEANFPAWYTPATGQKYGRCQTQTPKTFLKNSVLWVSHLITTKLGPDKFQEYVSKLNYGNRDVSGTPGKNDGLYNSWLGTSLKISPHEQVEFLEKLLANELYVSKDAQEKTKEIMDREEAWGGWKLYGKTAGGNGDNGWFIGWIERDGKQIVFAQYLDLNDPDLGLENPPKQSSVGLTAKELIKRNILNYLLSSLDK